MNTARLAIAVCALAVVARAFTYTDSALDEADIEMLEEPLLYRYRESCQELLATTNATSIVASVTGSLTLMASYGCDSNCTARLVAAFQKHYPSHWEELQGIAACLRWNSGITTLSASTLAAAAYTYEISRGRSSLNKRDVEEAPEAQDAAMPLGCAGILTCGPHGEVLHGRNYDWAPPFSYYLARTTRALEYLHTGTAHRRTFKTVDLFPGVFGATFGVNKGFSLAANARQYRQGMEGLLRCIESDNGMVGVHTAPIGHYLRWVLENVKTYDDAVQVFQNAKLCAPLYVILGGPHGQGAVLTLGSPASTTPKRTLSCTDDDWFLVQTNWDNKTHSLNNGQLYDMRWGRIEEKLSATGRATFVGTSHSAKGVQAIWDTLTMQANSTDCGSSPYCLSGALLKTAFFTTVYSAVGEPSTASLPRKAVHFMD